jgi:hypothetical protein
MESLPQREDNNTVRLRTEIHKALEALMVQDKANHGKAESMKGFFISQIRDINRERNLQAYTPNSGDSVFVDREG